MPFKRVPQKQIILVYNTTVFMVKNYRVIGPTGLPTKDETSETTLQNVCLHIFITP